MKKDLFKNYAKAQECFRIGEYNDGLDYAKKQLQIDLEIHGEHSLEVARDYNSIGIFYSKLKNIQKALYYLESALKIRESILGKNSYDANMTRKNVEYLKNQS